MSTQTPTSAGSELRGRHVCPFCGGVHDQAAGQCPHCALSDTAATRHAARTRIGPWHVLQDKNPAAPGLKFAVLLSLVRRKKITPESIVRGPTTHQLWRPASRVKGVSREFGLCWGCGGRIDRSAEVCPHCHRGQAPPADPDIFIEPREMAPDRPLVQREIPPPADFDLVSVPPLDLADAAPAGAATAPPTSRAGGELDVSSPPRGVFEPDPAAGAQPQPASPPRPEMSPRPQPPRPQPRVNRPPHKPVRPPPETPPGENDKIFTARELASVFKLDFIPPHILRRRRLIRAAVALLVLGLIITGIWLYADVDGRERFTGWWADRYASASSWIAGIFAREPESEPELGLDMGRLAPLTERQDVRDPSPSQTDPPAPPEPQPTVPAPPPPVERQVEPARAEPAPPAAPVEQPTPPRIAPEIVPEQPVEPPADVEEPAADEPAEQPPPAIEPSPEPVREPRPDPREEVQLPQPPDDPTPQELRSYARQLWIAALDAQARQDYRTELGAYEQMKQLPREYWYTGLEVRLEASRRRVDDQ